jgi:hypothetical protein
MCRAVDFSRASGMSMGKQVKLFVQTLNKAVQNRGHSKFTTDELERLVKDMRMQLTSFPDFLDVSSPSYTSYHDCDIGAPLQLQVLNQQSYLLKTGPREWKLAS